jgi:hypothetical protein
VPAVQSGPLREDNEYSARARQHGVEVSLGVNWNASGSDTIFDELRVAQQVNEEQWSGAIPPSDWVQMITTHPARALAVDHLIGSLQPGHKADFTVVRQRVPEPGSSLLQNHLADVEMVWIGGQLQYGTASVVQTVRPDVCEVPNPRGRTLSRMLFSCHRPLGQADIQWIIERANVRRSSNAT